MEAGTSNNNSSSRGSGVIVTRDRGIRIENPFSLKVGQVFTGFGIGCGVGIGVGRPINLGAIPMLSQVMSATRGATDAFSGVGRHVNSSMKKLGMKNIEAGIGCGVGLGHGFGVGLSVKPWVVNQLQSGLLQAITSLMMKVGIAPNLSIGQNLLPASMQRGLSIVNESSNRNVGESIIPSVVQVPAATPQGTLRDTEMNIFSSHDTLASRSTPLDTSYGSRTEKVIDDFLQSPFLKNEDNQGNQLAEHLQSENYILQMVLKHQQIIEELLQENEKLRQILLEDLKVSPTKLHGGYTRGSRSPCTDCFECRRKHRKGR